MERKEAGFISRPEYLFEVSDVKPREMLPIGPDEALAQLKQGKIDAMFYVAGFPVKLFTEDVTAADGLALIPITNKSILEFYPSVQIPANTYGWQSQPINTVAVKAVLISYDFRAENCENVGKVCQNSSRKSRMAEGERSSEMEIGRSESSS